MASRLLRRQAKYKADGAMHEKLHILRLVRLCGYKAYGGDHSAYFECYGKRVRVANHTRRSSHWSSQKYDHPEINVLIVGTTYQKTAKDALEPDCIIVRKSTEPVKRTARRLKIALSDILDGGENMS